MKRIYLLIVAALMVYTLDAQTFAGKIKGRVSDQQQKGIEGASITLHRSVDSSVVRMAVAKNEGAFEIDQLAEGKYFLAISAAGFTKYNSGLINISPSTPVYELTEISLSVAAVQLNEVTVAGKRPLIELKNDRTIVNVDAAVTILKNFSRQSTADTEKIY